MSKASSISTEVNTISSHNKEFDWSDGDLKTLYIHDTKKHPRISSEEVAVLSKLVQQGIEAAKQLASNDARSDEELDRLKWVAEMGHQARNDIIVANTGLVFRYANHYENKGVDYLDLIQAGNEGLIRAVEKFDPDMGYEFSTYATTWIDSFIYTEIHKSSRTIQIAIEPSAQLKKMQRIMREHLQASGEEMSIEAIAKEMDKKPEEILDLMNIEHKMVSVNTMVGIDDDQELSEFLIDSEAYSVEDRALDRAAEQAIVKAVRRLLAMSSLDELSKEVISMEYGIGYEAPLSRRAIKKILKRGEQKIKTVSEEAMEQLLSEASQLNMAGLLD